MRLGYTQTLVAVKKTDFGLFLTDIDKKDDKNRALGDEVLLPKNQVTEDMRVGSEIEVFLYKDSEDRMIATRLVPYIKIGEIKKLKVKEVNKIGAFLDWGLPKDLLLPFKEQIYEIKPGDEILVTVYIDLSDRLCATMDLYSRLSLLPPYQRDDMVKGTVYQVHEQFGAYVAVDNKYSALVPKKELHRELKPGDEIEARVLEVKEDGKLDLSLRQKAYVQMDADSALILDKLKQAGGSLPYQDKSSAEEIKEEFNLSKAAFKRAIGRLYKERMIVIEKDGIRLV
ncbi:MAG: S1 RNA-binding domain-containing protein [Lachnospiraceae bacterium]|nr:S1 RNA-binding domain-containing protein [Lachnospiraceae bacterium]